MNQMFHLKENMPVSNSTSVEAGSLPLIMWHAADDVSASVWGLACLVQLDLLDACWSEPLRIIFVSLGSHTTM